MDGVWIRISCYWHWTFVHATVFISFVRGWMCVCVVCEALRQGYTPPQLVRFPCPVPPGRVQSQIFVLLLLSVPFAVIPSIMKIKNRAEFSQAESWVKKSDKKHKSEKICGIKRRCTSINYLTRAAPRQVKRYKAWATVGGWGGTSGNVVKQEAISTRGFLFR